MALRPVTAPSSRTQLYRVTGHRTPLEAAIAGDAAMEPYMILAAVFVALSVFALVSVGWGVDSRDSIGDQHQRTTFRHGNW